MKLPSLITIDEHRTESIDKLAHMMGESFLEEAWTRTLLDVLQPNTARILEVSRAIMHADFTLGSRYHCVYALEDFSACAGGYLKSDLGSKQWNDIEKEAFTLLKNTVLSSEETAKLDAQMKLMEPVSLFDWEEDTARALKVPDFIHFYALGVDCTKRGTGAFRRLMTPFLTYADAQGIPCFLETYSNTLESLYSHFGFETIRILSDTSLALSERCMVRFPHENRSPLPEAFSHLINSTQHPCTYLN